jgi:RimJ/RimL family protein N-acetyltransferase
MSMLAERIDGDGIVLRRYRESDADDLAAACNDEVIQHFMPQMPSPYERADALNWINQGAPAGFAGGGANFAVVDPATDRLLGAVGLTVDRPGSGNAETGYWVAPWARRRGVATAAERAIAAVAFATGIARLELLTRWENTNSQRVAIACGFRREGIRRGSAANRDGSREDRLVWSRLAGDPDGPTPRVLPDLPDGHLTDGVITLLPLTAEDAPNTFALRSLPDVINTSVPAVAPNRDDITARCAHSAAEWLAGQRADFTIRDAATGTYAGEIGMYYWESMTQQAMIGYSMLPEWRQRGFTVRAARLVSAWAFSIGVKRVIAGTAPENIGSQRVLERAGFVREGYQRSRLPSVGDQRIDDILYALLPE